jgi:hypothetical protein
MLSKLWLIPLSYFWGQWRRQLRHLGKQDDGNSKSGKWGKIPRIERACIAPSPCISNNDQVDNNHDNRINRLFSETLLEIMLPIKLFHEVSLENALHRENAFFPNRIALKKKQLMIF